MRATIGIIGGTGIYDPTMFQKPHTVSLSTPFGRPSAPITVGLVGGKSVAFLPRHGIGHTISPSELNSRANLFALKKLGVERVIACSAVGSLKETIKPLDLVVPDQIFDRTKARPSTFFGGGAVVHISFAEPFCPELSALLTKVGGELGHRVHPRGTYVCIEGPQFSTRAESAVHRQLGFDIIGMTALPEAKLAREAEMCYAMLAAVTDWDVWKPRAKVDVRTVISHMKRNEATIRAVLKAVIPQIPSQRACACGRALEGAIMTVGERIPARVRRKLALLIGKYLER
jgi:5'-methylthioadenosine phosphorylase